MPTCQRTVCSPLFIHEMAPPIFRVGLPTTINPLKKTPHSIPTGQPNLDSSSWRRPSCVIPQWVKPIRIHHHTVLTLVPVHIPRQTETPFPGVRHTERMSSFPVSLSCFWIVFRTRFKNLPSLLRSLPFSTLDTYSSVTIQCPCPPHTIFQFSFPASLQYISVD